MLISYSKWDKFRTCPYKYKLHYIDNWRPNDKKAIYAFGHCCHGAITHLLYHRGDPVKAFMDLWAAQGVLEYSKGDSAPRFREIGQVLMARASEKLKRVQEVANIEAYFRMPFGKHELEGYVDFTGVLDGKQTIFDIKTLKSCTDYEVRLSEQLTFYATALNIHNVGFITLTKTQNPAVDILVSTRTKKRIEEFKNILLWNIQQIEELYGRGFFPKANHKLTCQMCDFRPICFGTKKEVGERLHMAAEPDHHTIPVKELAVA